MIWSVNKYKKGITAKFSSLLDILYFWINWAEIIKLIYKKSINKLLTLLVPCKTSIAKKIKYYYYNLSIKYSDNKIHSLQYTCQSHIFYDFNHLNVTKPAFFITSYQVVRAWRSLSYDLLFLNIKKSKAISKLFLFWYQKVFHMFYGYWTHYKDSFCKNTVFAMKETNSQD